MQFQGSVYRRFCDGKFANYGIKLCKYFRQLERSRTQETENRDLAGMAYEVKTVCVNFFYLKQSTRFSHPEKTPEISTLFTRKTGVLYLSNDI